MNPIEVEQRAYDWLVGVGVPSYLLDLIIGLFAVLILCYLIYVFAQHLSKRNLFSLDLSKFKRKSKYSTVERVVDVFLYVLKYLVLFPLYTLIWGGVLTLFLILLISSPNYESVIFFSTIIIAAIRIIAYLNEKYANELAKVLPLWLLVTILLEPTTIAKWHDYINVTQLLKENVVLYSVGFIVVIEWGMRFAYGIEQKVEKRFDLKLIKRQETPSFQQN